MNTETNKKISSFLDSELDSSEEENLLLEIKKDPRLINKLNRYQSVNHALKNDSFLIVDKNFLDGVKKWVDQEPHYLLPKQKVKSLEKRQFSSWQKASVAIAASAVMAVILVSQKNNLNNTGTLQDSSFVAQKTIKADPIIANTQEEKVQIVGIGKEKQVQEQDEIQQHERLKAYLHAQDDDLPVYDPLNFQPYARVASQD